MEDNYGVLHAGGSAGTKFNCGGEHLSQFGQIPNIRCNPERFCEMVSALDMKQKEWVSEMGFESLLRLSIRRIDRSLVLWLMNRFDTATQTIHVRENLSIKLRANDVGWVLGIPGPNRDVPRTTCPDLLRRLKFQFGNNKGIEEKSVFWNLTSNSHNDIEFKQTFLLYTLGVLLCPTQSSKISPMHLKVIHTAGDAHSYNWCQYAFDWLLASAIRFKKSRRSGIGFGGCSLFLMIFYLDRLNLGEPVNWSLTACRVDAWRPNLVRYVINLDKKPTGEFGGVEIVEGVVYGKEYPIGTTQIRWEEIRSSHISKMLKSSSATTNHSGLSPSTATAQLGRTICEQ